MCALVFGITELNISKSYGQRDGVGHWQGSKNENRESRENGYVVVTRYGHTRSENVALILE